MSIAVEHPQGSIFGHDQPAKREAIPAAAAPPALPLPAPPRVQAPAGRRTLAARLAVTLLFTAALAVAALLVWQARAGAPAARPSWRSVVSLSSGEPRGLDSSLTSAPFFTWNRVRLVLSLPPGESLAGLKVQIVPVGQAGTSSSALRQPLILGTRHSQADLSGLNGLYLLKIARPGSRVWSLDIQTSN